MVKDNNVEYYLTIKSHNLEAYITQKKVYILLKIKKIIEPYAKFQF